MAAVTRWLEPAKSLVVRAWLALPPPRPSLRIVSSPSLPSTLPTLSSLSPVPGKYCEFEPTKHTARLNCSLSLSLSLPLSRCFRYRAPIVFGLGNRSSILSLLPIETKASQPAVLETEVHIQSRTCICVSTACICGECMYAPIGTSYLSTEFAQKEKEKGEPALQNVSPQPAGADSFSFYPSILPTYLLSLTDVAYRHKA